MLHPPSPPHVVERSENAAYAVRSQEKPLVTIRIELQNGKAVLKVSGWDRSGKIEIDLVAADEKRRIAWIFEMERPGCPSEEWAVRQKAARMLEACRTLHGFDVRTKCLTMEDVMRPVEEFAPPD